MAADKKDGVYKEAEILKDVRFPGGLKEAVLILMLLPLAAASLIWMLLRELIKKPFSFFSSRPRRFDLATLPPRLQGLSMVGFDVAEGVRLHGYTFGRQPSKPLMLFLHGFPECWYSWKDQLAEFRDRFEVVALDMRGYNTSSKPLGISAYALEHLTADVAAVVRALGRSSCTLVAHDWGGAVAYAVAGRYPALVDRLAVLAAPHWLLYMRNLGLEQAARSYYFLWFLLPVLPELLLLHTDSAFTGALWLGRREFSPLTAGAATAEDVEVYKAALQQPGAATAALNYYRAMLLTSTGIMPLHPEVARGLRRQLDMPLLVVWGEKDHALCLSNNTDLDQVAPRCRVHVLPGCSHWVQADAPQRLNAAINEWLADHPLEGEIKAAAPAAALGQAAGKLVAAAGQAAGKLAAVAGGAAAGDGGKVAVAAATPNGVTTRSRSKK